MGKLRNRKLRKGSKAGRGEAHRPLTEELRREELLVRGGCVVGLPKAGGNQRSSFCERHHQDDGAF